MADYGPRWEPDHGGGWRRLLWFAALVGCVVLVVKTCSDLTEEQVIYSWLNKNGNRIERLYDPVKKTCAPAPTDPAERNRYRLEYTPRNPCNRKML